MWTVAFVIGFSPCQLLKHLPTCRGRPALVQLVLASGELPIMVCVRLTTDSPGKGKGKEGKGEGVIRTLAS